MYSISDEVFDKLRECQELIKTSKSVKYLTKDTLTYIHLIYPFIKNYSMDTFPYYSMDNTELSKYVYYPLFICESTLVPDNYLFSQYINMDKLNFEDVIKYRFIPHINKPVCNYRITSLTIMRSFKNLYKKDAFTNVSTNAFVDVLIYTHQ